MPVLDSFARGRMPAPEPTMRVLVVLLLLAPLILAQNRAPADAPRTGTELSRKVDELFAKWHTPSRPAPPC